MKNNKKHILVVDDDNRIRDLKENQCLSTIGNKYIHWRESYKYPQHDDNDDAHFQVIHNPVTFRECNDVKNTEFYLGTIEEQNNKKTNTDTNSYKSFIMNGYKQSSSKDIRKSVTKNNDVGLSI